MNGFFQSITAAATALVCSACDTKPRGESLNALRPVPPAVEKVTPPTRSLPAITSIEHSTPYPIKDGSTWYGLLGKFLDEHPIGGSKNLQSAYNLSDRLNELGIIAHVVLEADGRPSKDQSSFHPGQAVTIITKINDQVLGEYLGEESDEETVKVATKKLRVGLFQKQAASYKETLEALIGPDESYTIREGDTMTNISKQGYSPKVASEWASLIRNYIEAKNGLGRDAIIYEGDSLSRPSPERLGRVLKGPEADVVAEVMSELIRYYQTVQEEKAIQKVQN